MGSDPDMLASQWLLLKSAARGTSLVSKIRPCLKPIIATSRNLYSSTSSQANAIKLLRMNEPCKENKLTNSKLVNIYNRRSLFTETGYACAKCQKTSQLLKYVYTNV
ncbi:hypothetical protein N7582_003385 [Saccharomyces uvarum]|nr:hypothetical protein N7582_003385 [Saccharomyces uvarum]